MPEGTQNSGISVQFEYSTPSGTGHINTSMAGGKVELYVPDRYYVAQWLAYENGAILLKQSDGQTVLAYPSLSITKNSSNAASGMITLEFNEVDLMGASSTVSGTSSVGLNMAITSYTSNNYTITPDGSGDRDVNITMYTTYGSAWMGYLHSMLTNAGLVNGTDYSLNSTVLSSGSTIIQLDLMDVGTFDYSQTTVNMSLST